MYEAEKKQEVDISIHSLRMEGDKDLEVSELRPSYFNPLPPHGGRLATNGEFSVNRNISIHSLRMEGDDSVQTRSNTPEDISIHSLRMEGDHFSSISQYTGISFQSTPSAWRETIQSPFSSMS